MICIIVWRIKILRYKVVLFVISLSISISFADDNLTKASSILKQQITANSSLMCTKRLACSSATQLINHYKQHNYKLSWIEEDGLLSKSGQDIVNILKTAYLDGLTPNNYHVKQINLLMSKIETDDNVSELLVSLDLTISDGFLLYAHDLYYGTIDARKVYPHWTNIKSPLNMNEQLDLAIDNPKTTVANLVPTYFGYTKLKSKLNEYQKVEANGGWDAIPDGDDLQLGDNNQRVKLVRQRLLFSGELTNLGPDDFNNDLYNAVLLFQQNNGLYDDGIIESQTLAELNVSARMRVRQIELNMDKMRLLPQNMGKDYLFINLPSYSLNVIHDGVLLMDMDVAVGGFEHQSCVLNSQIKYLVLNPYWNIPFQIAQSEIWPILKSNPSYLKNHHVQVLKKDKNGNYKEVSTEGFNWSKMLAKEFNRYRYRQAPNESNALGKVKFIFPNSCGIYLHDTNETEAFDVYLRDFSHGCIRVSQPLNLTTFILDTQKKWSSNKVFDMFQHDINKTVSLSVPFDLYIMYLTSFVDDDWVQFRPDIYHTDKPQLLKYGGFMPKVHH